MTTKPPPKRHKGEPPADSATSHPLGSVWETGVFPFLDTKTLLTTARGVNRSLRRQASSFLVERRLLDGAVHTGDADNNDMDDHGRRVTVIIRSAHTKDFGSSEALVERAVQACDACWEDKGASDCGVYEFLRFAAADDDGGEERDVRDAEADELELNEGAVRRVLEANGEASACEDGYGWVTKISFESSTDLTEIIRGTPFDGNGPGTNILFNSSGGIPDVVWDDDEEDDDFEEGGKVFIVLAQCMRLLLREVVPSKSYAPRLATLKCVIYHPDFEEAVAYSGTEHCLQFMLAMANNDDKDEEYPVELYVLGEISSRDYPNGFLGALGASS